MESFGFASSYPTSLGWCRIGAQSPVCGPVAGGGHHRLRWVLNWAWKLPLPTLLLPYWCANSNAVFRKLPFKNNIIWFGTSKSTCLHRRLFKVTVARPTVTRRSNRRSNLDRARASRQRIGLRRSYSLAAPAAWLTTKSEPLRAAPVDGRTWKLTLSRCAPFPRSIRRAP